MIQKQKSGEVSSSQKVEDKDRDIKENYKEIKAKNEEIKNEIYSQYLKQTLGIKIGYFQPLIIQIKSF